MIESDFQAAMTEDELMDGEVRHQEVEQSRKLAMLIGLTKTSHELRQVWESDRDTYVTLLRGAVAAYEQAQPVGELLGGAIARLASVADDVDSELINAVSEIVTTRSTDSEN